MLFYMHMLDYNRFSSQENVMQFWGFHCLDDLCASKELGWNYLLV